MKHFTIFALLIVLLFTVSCSEDQPLGVSTDDSFETTDISTTETVETTSQSMETTESSTMETEETTLQSTETTYVEALGEYKVKLSTMSEEDCLKFLEEAGVEIPEKLQGVTVKDKITYFENNLEAVPVYGWGVLQAFSEDIQSAVRHYYGLPYLWEIWDWYVPHGTTGK